MEIFDGEESSSGSRKCVSAEANLPEAPALQTLRAHVHPHREDVVQHGKADVAHPVESRQAVDPNVVEFDENHARRVIIRSNQIRIITVMKNK